MSPSAPPAGCYVPAVTFFKRSTDRVDFDAQASYFSYLADSGLTGIVVLGTNAETLLLTREERNAILTIARKSVPDDFPIIAGVSGHSTVQVLEYIQDAYHAGSDYVLLLPCAYFGKQTTSEVISGFFEDIAQQSPLPIVLYNFPAVCNGIDLDSEIITSIARRNENVVGVKLTCGSVAKIARLAATFPPNRFAVFGGQSDFLLGGLAVGSAGCIAAFANVFPRSVARLYRLWEVGKQKEALQLQQQLALAESPTKAGIAATKYAAAIFTAPRANISDAQNLLLPRRPYIGLGKAAQDSLRERIGKVAWLEDEDGKNVNGLSIA